jgi:beta-glucanase (GH16 family)
MRHAPSRLLFVFAAALLAGGVLVPASGVGAVTGNCGLLSGLTGGCRTAAPAVTTSTPCPASTPRPAGRHAWVCTFDDEFSGGTLNRAKWAVQTTAQHGFHSGAECLQDDPRNVSVSGGHLNLTVRETASFVCPSPTGAYRTSWVGGSIYTRTFDQVYGRFEFRARFPEAYGKVGLQSALWMYPRQMKLSNATSGPTEIDVAEAYSKWRDYVSPSVHAYLSGRSVSCKVSDYGAAFHTYAVEWSRRAALFYYDGALCMRVLGTGSLQPFMLALSQVLGVTTNTNNAATPLPATMQVDWVRAWK